MARKDLRQTIELKVLASEGRGRRMGTCRRKRTQKRFQILVLHLEDVWLFQVETI